MLIKQLVIYLQDTLNLAVTTQKWRNHKLLPYFLQDNYVFYLADIYGLELLLMVAASDVEYSPAAVHKHMEQVKKTWTGEVVYVREQISSFARKRLVEAGIPFIVPGNQLYLPMLAMDLREYFRRPKQRSIHKFSPATQVLGLYWIYNSSGNMLETKRTPTEMARLLGYTKMTMSRAFKEIEAALDEINSADDKDDDQKYELSGREFFFRLQPYWRNPVRRRNYLIRYNPEYELGLRAGLTALATYSMLAEPSQWVYALGQHAWRLYVQNEEHAILDSPDNEAVEVEIWDYNPGVLSVYGNSKAVDPLSLYLSLKESNNERVETALEELLKGI